MITCRLSGEEVVAHLQGVEKKTQIESFNICRQQTAGYVRGDGGTCSWFVGLSAGLLEIRG